MEPLDPAGQGFGGWVLPKTLEKNLAWTNMGGGKMEAENQRFLWGDNGVAWWDMVRCIFSTICIATRKPLIEKGSKFYLFGCSFFGPFLF